MVHAWKNFNGTVSFVGRRSRNVFLDRIGRQNDLYTSCSPTNPFSCTSLSLFLISRLVSRSTNWDQSIFANSKYGNQMSQFPGIRGKLGLNRRSSNMFLIGFHLDTCHWSGLGYLESILSRLRLIYILLMMWCTIIWKNYYYFVCWRIYRATQKYITIVLLYI